MTYLLINQDPHILESGLLSLLRDTYNVHNQSVDEFELDPDIHVVSNPTNIGIDDVKALQRALMYKPFQSANQFGVISDAQKMTVEAQNAMLKSLEEQEPNTHYILLCHNEKSLLDTIRSRSIKLYINNDLEARPDATQLDTPEILQMDLVEQFERIEEIEQAYKQDPQSLQYFTSSLAQYFRMQMLNNPHSSASDIVEKIMQFDQRSHSNINLKLALEHMIIYINERTQG